MLVQKSFTARGNSQIFFRTPPLKSQKNHIQNHKITRKIAYRKHQKSQITDKLLKNHTKKSLEITKITKNHREKSCDFKITKITYAILRSDSPLALRCSDCKIFAFGKKLAHAKKLENACWLASRLLTRACKRNLL